MLIELKDPRPGPISLQMGNETYVFRANDKGHKVALVWVGDHIKCFLAVSHLYSEYNPDAPEPEAAPKADEPPPADGLILIKGIGARLVQILAAFDPPVTTLDQVAAWTNEDVARYEGLLKFPGRITRERWVEQAKAMRLPKGAEPAPVNDPPAPSEPDASKFGLTGEPMLAAPGTSNALLPTT